MSSRSCVTGRARHGRLQHGGQLRRGQPQAPRLRLIDLDPQAAARARSSRNAPARAFGIGGDNAGQVQRTGPQHLGVGAGQAVLQRPADGRPQFQRADAADRLGEFFVQKGGQAVLQPVARREVLGHHDDLRVVVAGRIDIQRQVEPDDVAPDVGGIELRVAARLDPVLDPLDRVLAGKDRTRPGQLEIDDQLVAVGRRERTAGPPAPSPA